MISNHAKGAILFASIYVIVFFLSTIIYVSKPGLVRSNPAIANAVISTPTVSKSTSNVGLLGAELVAITMIAVAEMRYKVLTKLYRKLKKYLGHMHELGTAARIIIALGIWIFVLLDLGFVWFIFLFINSIGVLIAYYALFNKLPRKQFISIFITFMGFFILWPFSFLFAGQNVILLIFLEFAYIPVMFLFAGLIMRHPTKNRINLLSFLFSILLPPILATLFLPVYAVILLGIFSAYDFIAVFWTKHMGFMAQKLLALNIPEAFLIGDFNQIKKRLKTINKPSQSPGYQPNRPLIFGVGDAVLPGMVISSFVLAGIPYLAIASVIGAIAGVIANLGVLRIRQHILPALPLIFSCMMIGIAIAVIA